MLLVAVQTILAALACYGLWRLLRVLSGYGRAVAWIVAAGFLGRAFLSQILFWISYLRLPIARPLQLGPGFWFFGVDAEFYFHYAATLVRDPATIIAASHAYPSPFYVQAFTVAVGLFGSVPSVGILLNCAAFAGICFLIARLGMRDGRVAAPAVFALAAVSFSPAGVLWSSQPLKDTFFLFFVTAAIAASFKWHELWTRRRNGRSVALPLAACALTLMALVYALSSMRWYFGFVITLSCAVLFAGTVFASQRRLAALVPNLLLFLVLSRVVVLAAGTDIPVPLRPALDWTNPKASFSLPGRVAGLMKDARTGYDRTPGATNIQAGTAIAETAPPPAPQTEPVTPAPVRKVETEPPPPVAKTTTTAVAKHEPKPEPKPETRPEPKPAPVLPATTTIAAAPPPATTTSTAAPAPVQIAEAVPPPATTTHATVSEEVPPAPVKKEPVAKPKRTRTRRATPAVAKPAPAKPAPVTQTAAPQPAPVKPVVALPPPSAPPPPVETMPKTTIDRLITGFAATFLPRTLAQKTGLIRVGGGRGFWLFADLDTLVFDIVLIFAIVYCTRHFLRRRGKMTATFAQVALMSLLIAGPVLYAVNNFGTLFRHRQMIYLGLCLLPMALAGRGEEPKPVDPATAM